MQTVDLIATYTYAGDCISVITCVALLVIIRQSLYFTTEARFSNLKLVVYLILIASVVNIVFSSLCERNSSNILAIYLTRDIYHVLLLSSMYIFIIYLRELWKIGGKFINIIRYITAGIYGAGCIFDVLSPVTHFGFCYDNGLWQDSTYLKPFTFVYTYFMILLTIMFLFYGKRMIQPVRYSLIAIQIISAIVLVLENTVNSNSLTTYTFILPILAVMILIHSNPFDVTTGAMSSDGFESYLKHIYAHHNAVDFMVLKLDLRNQKQVPTEVGKVMYSFWYGYFKDAMLFKLSNEEYVLAIRHSSINGDIASKMDTLLYQVFPKYYQQYDIPYQIVGLCNIDFIQSREEMIDAVAYFKKSIEMNTIHIATEKEIEELHKIRYVKEQLADISVTRNLEDERVRVFVQPVMNVQTKRYDSAEALMRLELPEYGMIFPDIFIPIAEKYEYIHGLSLIILNKVCKKIHELMKEGYLFQRISVNFSISEMREKNFCCEVIDIIKKNDIPFEKLGFELTESQNDSDYNFVKEKISILKQYGIKLYLDDFGTGYSNFERILRLGMDVIKFDRSLLLCADTDANMQFTLLHFSQAFREMGFSILFEGVETANQEELCLSCGADYLQGYKFSRPVKMELLPDYFEK